MRLEGSTAVLTGAASGIGRALAMGLADAGGHLALVDRDGAGLQATADTLARRPGAATRRVSLHVVDLSDRAVWPALPAAVAATHPRVDLLVNNAGVALGGRFEEVAAEDFDWLMRINFEAVVGLTRAFLPALRAAGGPARVVNVSSLYGLVSPPGQTAYSASKFAVRGFSNALRQELRGSPVGVTVVHPGGVATAIARSARVPAGADPAEVEAQRAVVQRLLRLPPERAARIILRGIAADRARVIVGADAAFAAWLERLMPVRHWAVLERLMAWAARRA